VSENSNPNAKRSRVVLTLEMKLKISPDFEAGKSAFNIRHEHGRTIVTDKHKYKYVAKLSVPGTIKCLRTRENILLRMEKLLLIWICHEQAIGCTVNSILVGRRLKVFSAV
jgi:hypothetical protein